ncbi:MliC family protein [Leptotrichia sp. oral taxon 218]|uniref:MliC family protein n=1 Tax=Leptotrichia sp. oral taxon 218 TaxID=712361 RepID=UPI001B8B82F3|nr:MliC family protein [Leptotrichia sp. oral taxon 218]QUB95027.1 MliC family protein [Leptotrichia sp. oral taxon 218]
MKLLKKSMLALSVMTLIGGMAFAAAPKNGKKAPARKTVAKKVVNKKAVAKRPAAESYTCGTERITVTYPTTKTAKVVTKAGKVYNLNVAVSGSGARYVSKGGNVEFFKGGKDAIYRGPNNIEKSCTRK